MADKRGFWLSVLGALITGSGFLVLQFVRLSRQEPGNPQTAWITVGAMVVTGFLVMVVVSAGVAWIAGWARREAYLKSMGTWDVVAPALRTDRIAEDLRRLGRTERRMPWGLTLTANSEGIGFWGGRSQITCELWLPRENVDVCGLR